MNMNMIRSLFALLLALMAQAAGQAPPAAPAAAGPYRVVKTHHVGGEAKYWDYLTFDEERGLLFASLGSHMAVIDAATGKTVGDIPGMKRCHGVALAPGVNRGFISDGDDEAVVMFVLKTYEVLGKGNVGPDGGGIHYDPATKR